MGEMTARGFGVSIAICCRDPARGLPEAFARLSAQVVPVWVPWEVLVLVVSEQVHSVEAMASRWAEAMGVPVKVVSWVEGSWAAVWRRGLAEARYECVSFVDDSDRLPSDWVRTVYEAMAARPDTGACSPSVELFFETGLEPSLGTYVADVLGRRAGRTGDVTWQGELPDGPGLTLRRSAWKDLVSNGFVPQKDGRPQEVFYFFGFDELCRALRLAGWRLAHDEDLRLRRFIAGEFTTVEFLLQLKSRWGESSVFLDPYDRYGQERSAPGVIWRQLGHEIYRATVGTWSCARAALSPVERRLCREEHRGRARALWRWRGEYDVRLRRLGSEDWVRIDCQTAGYLRRHPDFGTTGTADGPCLSPNPLVSVIVTNYNYGRYLARAIDSVLSQTWTNLEVIVVDDGSTDESREVLAHYEGRVRTVLKENGGQASAFNAGISAAKGEILCFLDSDDLFKPEKVEWVVSRFRLGKWGLICHRLLEFESDQDVMTGRDANTGLPVHQGEVEAVIGDVYEHFGERGNHWVFQPTSAMSVLADVARQLTPFPEEDWRICADNPLAYGAALHGPLLSLDEPLGYYRIHGNNSFITNMQSRSAKYMVRAFLHPLLNHDYLTSLAGVHDPRLRNDPDRIYPYFRRMVFAFSDKPIRRIAELIRANLRYHARLPGGPVMRWMYILRWAAVDVALAVALAFGIARRHDRLRREMRAVIDAGPERFKQLTSNY